MGIQMKKHHDDRKRKEIQVVVIGLAIVTILSLCAIAAVVFLVQWTSSEEEELPKPQTSQPSSKLSPIQELNAKIKKINADRVPQSKPKQSRQSDYPGSELWKWDAGGDLTAAEVAALNK